jgi:hypothetical protein
MKDSWIENPNSRNML